jgi:hypothetical protein
MNPTSENEKGETPDSHSSAPQLPAKVKQIKLTPEGVNQRDVDAVLKRLTQMRKRLREDILFIGGHLAKMRDTKIPYGGWTAFVERTFPLSVKTANIWIRAWENRDSELAVNDWDAYMRALYGNEPKKLKGGAKWEKRSSDPDEDEESDEDLKQHGGEGLQTVFPDRGKPVFLGFKNLVAALQHDFFGSKEYSLEAKEQFIDELIKWLETQRKNLWS